MTDFSYNTAKRVVPVGEESHIDVTGTWCQVLETSHNTFGVRLDSGSLQYWDKGIQIGGPSGELPFKKVTIVNQGPDPLTLILGFGSGDFADRRISFPGGALPVEFDGNQPVAVQSLPIVTVEHNNSQPVHFDDAQPVAVQSLPIVTVEHNNSQPIHFDDTQPVAVQSLPKVTVEHDNSQPVHFDNAQPVSQSEAVGWRQSGAVLIEDLSPQICNPGSAVWLSGASDLYQRRVFRNLGTEPVWLKANANMWETGHKLYPGESHEVTVRGDVYAVNFSGVPVKIGIYAEKW